MIPAGCGRQRGHFPSPAAVWMGVQLWVGWPERWLLGWKWCVEVVVRIDWKHLYYNLFYSFVFLPILLFWSIFQPHILLQKFYATVVFLLDTLSHVLRTGFLGHYNRTCTTSQQPSKTAGPVLRRRGNIWEQWVLMDVQDKSTGSKTATLMTYIPEGFDARWVA